MLNPAFRSKQIVTGNDAVLENIRTNAARDLPWLREEPSNNLTAIIVGGGPSLKKTWKKLKKLHKGGVVFSTNKTPEYLKQRGIKTDIHILVDPQETVADYVDDDDKLWLVNTGCHPKVFDTLEGKRVVAMHCNCDDLHEQTVDIIKSTGRATTLPGGGETAAHKAMEVAFILGFRDIKLFGFDASGEGHAYEHGDVEQGEHVDVLGKRFSVTPAQLRQAGQYEHQHKQMVRRGVKVTAYGNSLIPTIARKIENVRASG